MPDPVALVVGAGPSGLTAALELHRCGVPFRVIDAAPHGALHSQALAVQARTLEQCERYGIVDEMLARGRRMHGARIYGNGTRLAHVRIDDVGSRYRFVLFLGQVETERFLTQALTDCGVEIERGLSLERMENGPSRSIAYVRDASGTERTIEARYVIGCDGIHSRVREIAAIPFAGSRVPEHFTLADVTLTGPDAPDDELVVYTRDGDLVFIARFAADTWRVLVERHSDRGGAEADPDLAHFQTAIDEIAGIDVCASAPTWTARFGITQRRAAAYRSGSAFLVGDAAHVHSPAGGQGMNTGMQDAANLAWKIAAVEAGAPAELLDTYDAERGKIGRDLLRGTSLALGAMTTDNPMIEALRDRIAPILTSFGGVKETIARNISQTSIHYPIGPAISDAGGHTGVVPGHYAPNVSVRDADGRSEMLHDTFADPSVKVVATAAFPRCDYVIDDATAQPYAGREPMAYVVRPDGYVGFRGPVRDAHALAAYLTVTGARATAP